MNSHSPNAEMYIWHQANSRNSQWVQIMKPCFVWRAAPDIWSCVYPHIASFVFPFITKIKTAMVTKLIKCPIVYNQFYVTDGADAANYNWIYS